ncbi:hypothetical protein D9M71_618800 [compost metagenome]
MDNRPVQGPIPAILPAQRLGQVLRACLLLFQCIDLALLHRLQHLQQQAALRPLRVQCAQQPELQGMVIGVVVFLANQQPLSLREPLQQLRGRQQPAAAQFTDVPKLGMLTAFGALPGWQRRCLGSGLAAGEPPDQQQQ